MSIIKSSSKSYKSDTIAAKPLVIRRAGPGDAAALDRLAALDSAAVPEGIVLVAEVGGEILAATGVEAGRMVADPFRPTADLAAMLELRAAQVRAATRRAKPRIVARAAGAPRLAAAPAIRG